MTEGRRHEQGVREPWVPALGEHRGWDGGPWTHPRPDGSVLGRGKVRPLSFSGSMPRIPQR
jgi:hypothetical protein